MFTNSKNNKVSLYVQNYRFFDILKMVSKAFEQVLMLLSVRSPKNEFQNAEKDAPTQNFILRRLALFSASDSSVGKQCEIFNFHKAIKH